VHRAQWARAAKIGVLVVVALLAPETVLSQDGSAAKADDSDALTPFTPCPHCKLLLGIGGTYYNLGWSDGIVVPVTLELADSRWEVGAFRFARTQIITGYGPPDRAAANPFWGFSAMRRWQFLHRSWGRLYLGGGVSYKTETDYLDGTRLNFAYVLAYRFDLGSHGPLCELAVRHWSNAWIKQPNRGQDFITVSLSF
jgi:Lipid A 3-O-deacylase (PagL)